VYDSRFHVPDSDNYIREIFAMTRRFEFVGGGSAKYWEAVVNGCAVTVRYGRLGSDGQTQAKSFADAAAAQQHADKMCGEKLKKGYQECVAR
jgi:predicted DNA-binding WGR domain protein